MKKIILFILITSLTSCATDELYKHSSVSRKGHQFDKKKLHLVAFFINKEAAWYGETDRFYARFYTVDPILEYFKKKLLTSSGIFIKKEIDYKYKCKEEKIQLPDMPRYTSAKECILMKRIVDYYQLIKRIRKPGDHFMLIEQHFNVIISGQNSRSALLSVNMYIMNSEAEMVFARRYSSSHPFKREDHATLVYFHKYSREKIQKRTMQIYSGLFLKTSRKMIRDLDQLSRK